MRGTFPKKKVGKLLIWISVFLPTMALHCQSSPWPPHHGKLYIVNLPHAAPSSVSSSTSSNVATRDAVLFPPLYNKLSPILSTKRVYPTHLQCLCVASNWVLM